MTPTPPTPAHPNSRFKLPRISWPFKWTGLRQIGAALATIALMAAFASTFALLRGSHGTGGQTSQIASGPAATATAIGTPTATPTPAPTATATPVPLHPNVVATQNQDMRPACTDPINAYTVVLANNGDVAANWHVDIPAVAVLIPPSWAAGQPLFSPRSASPFWAQAQPADGSVAPGQTASFVMAPDWAMPCGGTTYHAAIKLSFPSGASEPDIPLTYAGTGPAPYSSVELLQPTSLNLSLPCPATNPTVTIVVEYKNTGNATAYGGVSSFPEQVGAFPWATITQVTMNPPGANSSWLFAGQTWTVTIQPRAIGPSVLCDGTTVYHVNLTFTLAQLTSQTFTISVTFR